ncbi:hypothetical protein KBC79_01190, partial [Candidatus Woesebacteria bacterium]|nr:hypothetical protein [Candidatus Woesebacteria bacterium]
YIMRQTVTELEEIFYNVIHSDFPHDWDENRVTFNLMKELKNFFTYKIINYSNFSKTVQWGSYKNRGTVENFFGDISLIFNIQFTTREVLHLLHLKSLRPVVVFVQRVGLLKSLRHQLQPRV